MGTLLLVSAFYLFAAANAAPAQTRPPGGLRETIIALDRMLFDAYNRCDLEPGFPFWPWYRDSIHPRRPEYHVFSR